MKVPPMSSRHGFAFVRLHVRNHHGAALRSASMRAVPSPSPEAPPVTMNTLPLISMSHLLCELTLT